MKIIKYCLILLVCLAGPAFSEPNRVNEERQYYHYHASSVRYLAVIDSAIIEARTRLVEILQDSLGYKPHIYIEDDLAEFKGRIGGVFPDWGAAAAIPYRETIVIKSPAHFRLGKSLKELTMHEYAHLAVSSRLFHGTVPRWLNEGIAMYVAAEWGWDQNFAMSKGVVFKSLVPLNEIDDMNKFTEGKAQVAYAQSYMSVKYLIEQYGIDVFNIMLDLLRARKTFDEALIGSIAANTEEFERELNKYLEGRYNYMTLFGDLYFLWIFLAIVVFGGYIISFFKKRKYYKKWDEEEKLQSTDFDYGDPDNPEQVDDEDEPWR